MSKLSVITWDVYEIRTRQTEIHGVMLRGRLRKLGLEQSFNVLCENATDAENCVRFAVPAGETPDPINQYVTSVIPDASVVQVATAIKNPVLSKLKVNKEERYTL